MKIVDNFFYNIKMYQHPLSSCFMFILCFFLLMKMSGRPFSSLSHLKVNYRSTIFIQKLFRFKKASIYTTKLNVISLKLNKTT